MCFIYVPDRTIDIYYLELFKFKMYSVDADFLNLEILIFHYKICINPKLILMFTAYTLI